MTRVEALLNALTWSQPRLAQAIGVGQATVSRLSNGQPESGLQMRVLDMIAREHGLDHLTAEAFAAQNAAPSSDLPRDADFASLAASQTASAADPRGGGGFSLSDNSASLSRVAAEQSAPAGLPAAGVAFSKGG